MTKEEKIKEDWGLLMPDYTNIDLNNGWSLNDFYEEDFNDNDFHTMQIYTPCKIRPKSLQGIENNNGWICIESEADLPPNTKEANKSYKVLCKNAPFPDNLINAIWGCTERHEKQWLKDFTHYKSIEEEKPPIY